MDISAGIKAVASFLSGSVVDKAMDIIDKVVPDKNLANQLKAQLDTLRVNNDHELEMAQVTLQQGQIDTNKEEAKSPSLFVAGWRPFIGWICGVGIGTNYFILPLLAACGVAVTKLDVSELMSLVIAMLGLAGYRTYEKKTGVV